MSIWLFIWLLLSGALLYFMVWTGFIMYRQKKTWKAFAERNKLRYKSSSVMGAPEITGPFGNYSVSVFTSEHMARDARGSRKLTAIEIQLSSKLPVDAGVASGGMVNIIDSMQFTEEMLPDHPGWDKGWVAKSSNGTVLKEYLSPARVEALIGLMKIKNSWMALVFRPEISLLRIDTPDPLDTDAKLKHILEKMTETAALLELASGESGRLKAYETAKPAKARKKAPASPVKEAPPVDLRLEEEPEEKPQADEKPDEQA